MQVNFSQSGMWIPKTKLEQNIFGSGFLLSANAVQANVFEVFI